MSTNDWVERQEAYRQQESQVWEALQAVQDRTSFLTFVRALMDDLAAWESVGGDIGWRNGANIGDCLGGSLRWLGDLSHPNVKERFPEEPSWRAFAVFLYMGKIYE